MKLAKLSLVAALVLGGLVAFSNLASAQDAPDGKKKRQTVEQRLEQMDKELKLTDEQKPKVKEVLEESGKKMAGLRDVAQDERQAKRKEIMDEQNKKLKEILKPDQFKKYEEMQQRMRGKGGKKGDNAGGEPKKSN